MQNLKTEQIENIYNLKWTRDPIKFKTYAINVIDNGVLQIDLYTRIYFDTDIIDKYSFLDKKGNRYFKGYWSSYFFLLIPNDENMDLDVYQIKEQFNAVPYIQLPYINYNEIDSDTQPKNTNTYNSPHPIKEQIYTDGKNYYLIKNGQYTILTPVPYAENN